MLIEKGTLDGCIIVFKITRLGETTRDNILKVLRDCTMHLKCMRLVLPNIVPTRQG